MEVCFSLPSDLQPVMTKSLLLKHENWQHILINVKLSNLWNSGPVRKLLDIIPEVLVRQNVVSGEFVHSVHV